MVKLNENAVGTVNRVGVWCSHCGRKCGTFARGAIQVNGNWVCRPNSSNELNCYDLVINHGHDPVTCGQCWTDAEKPPSPKIRMAETNIL